MTITTAITTGTMQNASPYWIALIAVLGTAFGAAISASTQMLTTRRSSANQLAILKLQLDHQTSEALRQERRQAYVRFLIAKDKWESLYLDTYEAVKEKSDPPDTDEAYFEYGAALAQLDLFAGEKLARLANGLYNQDVNTMDGALEGKDPDETRQEGGVLPVQVTAAMQEELQFVGGVPIDPKTGIRVWDHDRGTDSLPSS
jgi:hypothetical protein